MNSKIRFAAKAGAAALAATALIIGSVAAPAQAAKKEDAFSAVVKKEDSNIKQQRDTGWGIP